MFTSFTPTTETESGVRFDAEIKFIQEGDVEFVKVNIPKQSSTGKSTGNRKQTTNTKKTQNIANKTSQQTYVGHYQASPIQSIYKPASSILGITY